MASLTRARNTVASYSCRVAILRQHLSHPMQRSTTLRRRCLRRSSGCRRSSRRVGMTASIPRRAHHARRRPALCPLSLATATGRRRRAMRTVSIMASNCLGSLSCPAVCSALSGMPLASVTAASQQPLKAGNVCKTGCSPMAGSWVSFGTQAPLGVEAASQTTEKPAAARRWSPNAENAALSACGPIRAQDSKRQAAQASAGDKILKAERGGFSRREIRKLLDELELCLKCLSQADLAQLRTLLVAYQFLPS